MKKEGQNISALKNWGKDRDSVVEHECGFNPCYWPTEQVSETGLSKDLCWSGLAQAGLTQLDQSMA